MPARVPKEPFLANQPVVRSCMAPQKAASLSFPHVPLHQINFHLQDCEVGGPCPGAPESRREVPAALSSPHSSWLQASLCLSRKMRTAHTRLCVPCRLPFAPLPESSGGFCRQWCSAGAGGGCGRASFTLNLALSTGD